MTQDAQNALRRGKAICSARRRPLWATRLNEQPDDLAPGELQGICSYTLVLFLNQSDLKIWSQHEHEWLESVDFMFLLRARPQLQVEYCFQWLQMSNIVTSRIISGWFVLKSSLLSLSFCFSDWEVYRKHSILSDLQLSVQDHPRPAVSLHQISFRPAVPGPDDPTAGARNTGGEVCVWVCVWWRMFIHLQLF